MANDIKIADIKATAAFMQAYLTERIPDGDFTSGSADYDININGFAELIAFLRYQQDQAKSAQSILTVNDLPDDQAVRDAVDAIMANIFRSRGGGKFARGQLLLHFSARTDFQILRNNRFFKTPTLVYYLDPPQDLFVSANSLIPVRGTDGRIAEYVYTVNVKAAEIGNAYNQPAGRFSGLDLFSPFVTFVENVNPLVNGTELQSTADFIRQSKNALSTRSLVNVRSNDATLTDPERFNTVFQTLTIGASDPEMVRDIITDPGQGLSLHIGGCSDIYVRMERQQVTEVLTVGSSFIRADDKKIVLKDISGTRNFVTGIGGGLLAPVNVGDVLFLAAGIPEAPFQYKVTAVRPTELEINARVPFSVATDELSTLTNITISIGNNYPNFNNKLGSTTSNQLQTSRTVSFTQSVGLVGRPIYRIKKIEITNASSAFDVWKNPSTNSLLFENRVNTDLITVPNAGDTLNYRLRVLNPTEGQSALAVNVLQVGWPGVDLNGLTIEVTYDTLFGFSQVDQFVRSPAERVNNAFVVPKGYHPIYLSMTIPYRLSVTTNPFLGNSVVPFDEDIAAQELAQFISSYYLIDVLDQSLLSEKVKSITQTVSTIYPFSIDYSFLAPDGRIFKYSSTDRISIFTDTVDNVTLLNPVELGLPSTNYGSLLRKILESFGVSDRNVCYFSDKNDISFERRG